MDNKEEVKTTRRHRGPGGSQGMGAAEKAKDFKGAIKRLFQELSGFRKLIALALILAMLSSILSILAPNKLSDLTDKISHGLVINTKNMEKLNKNITNSLTEDKLKSSLSDVLQINLTQKSISQIMTSDKIDDSEKQKIKEIMTSSGDTMSMMTGLTELSDNALEIILPKTTTDGVEISTTDKKEFLSVISKMSDKKASKTQSIKIPESIGSVLIDSVTIDGVKVTGRDQAKFLNAIGSVNRKSSIKKIYAKLDKMPKSIRKIVEPEMDMTAIKNIAMFLVCLYLCSALFNYIESIAMTSVSNNFARKLRNKISTKINKLPLKYFDSHAIGDILSRVTNDVDTIAQSMNQSLATLVSSITLFLGTIIMMFITNWIMALTAILSSLIGFVFMFKVLGKSQKYFVARQTELGNLNGHIEEIYSGLNVVKAYNGKYDADRKFDEYNEKVFIANRKSQFLSGLMMPMMNFIGNFGYVCVCIVGALLTMNDVITFGVIVAFMTYVRLFTSPLAQIAQAMTSLQSPAAASERVFDFIDEKEMDNQENIVKHLEKNNVKGKIEFSNVVFKYDGNDKPTINNFSAKAKPGEKIAIVGPTGAGKTTMVNLLMKFYNINSGDIKIDGVSINELTRENIHDLFTMVLQDTWLFNGTIRENIVYNRENISDEKVSEVCKTVGLDHFIKTLPDGYDTVLSDNDSVSAGQRQLLTIARGMIEDSPFLILDEATSNVDTRTEELVQQAMDKLTEGKTSFIIAHRLSTIKNADLILVMKDGNIIETGKHDELMKKKGFYAELYNSQFEL